MPLDSRWLIRPRKKIRPNFLRSTSLLYKIVPTNLGACKPIFYTIYALHLRWNSTMRSMRHCFYHADRMQYFTILQYKLHSFSIRDDRSTRGLYRHRNDPHHRNNLRHRNDPQSPSKWSPPPKWYRRSPPKWSPEYREWNYEDYKNWTTI